MTSLSGFGSCAAKRYFRRVRDCDVHKALRSAIGAMAFLVINLRLRLTAIDAANRAGFSNFNRRQFG